MGIGNLISNFLFGGLGILDMVGGFGVGVVTTGIIVGMRKLGLSAWWAMLPIVFVPALCVPLWLSPLLGPTILAISVESYRGSNYSSDSWFCIGESFMSRPSMAALLGAFK